MESEMDDKIKLPKDKLLIKINKTKKIKKEEHNNEKIQKSSR